MVTHIRVSCILFARDCRLFLVDATPATDISTLSLHDALPIFAYLLRIPLPIRKIQRLIRVLFSAAPQSLITQQLDRKSTRLNSSHRCISYAVFCLKKKTRYKYTTWTRRPKLPSLR